MKYLTLSVIMIGGLLIASCNPYGPEYYEDLDIVITNYNDNYDFAGKETYAMPDSIVKITGNLQEGDDPVFIPKNIAAQILQSIEDNMSAYGWQRVDLETVADPDLILVPASLETTTIYYWYDYWYWWWGGFYPGWGWDWWSPGGWYEPVYGTTYTTGTLIMTLLDPDELAGNGNPLPQWTGALNGLLYGSYNSTRMNKGIDQAFDQSPYLETNK